jgi:hypothetical protein
LIVHAVLDPNASSQTVLVQYIDGSFGHSPTEIFGALVTITAPDGGIFFANEQGLGAGRHYYSVVGLGIGSGQQIVPGGTYTLHVYAPEGEEATGTTTVPEFARTADQIEVFSSFYRATDTLRLSWEPMPLAKRYEVTVESFFGSSPLGGTYRVFADTSITIAGTARTIDNDPVFPEGGSAAVVVAAVDDNYYTYYHPSVDPFAGAPPSRLTGALGVFGSIVPISIRTYRDIR